MNQSVSHTCPVDIAGFGVGDIECVIRSMYVGFISQLTMKRVDVVGEPVLKFAYIFLIALAV